MKLRARCCGVACLIASSIAVAAPLRAADAPASTSESKTEKVPPEPAAADTAPPPAWYGWQVLAADGAGLILGASLAFGLDDGKRRPTDLGIIAATWYGVGAVGAPAVHLAHGAKDRAGGSFAARALIPPAAGLGGLMVNCLANGDFYYKCRRDGVLAGTVLGLVGAAALDVTTFSEPRTSTPPVRPWYGWKLLIMDGAALAGGAYLALNPPEPKEGAKQLSPQLGLWVPDYVVGLFGGPITHALHGQWLNGLASLGARALVGPMFALPGVFGYCAATAAVKDCSETGATFGILAGLLLVDAFDAFALGYDDAPEDSATESFSPILHVAPGFVALSGPLP